MQVTKAQLLQGKEYTEEFEVPEMGGTVTLRPLTAREWMKISNSLLKGMDIPANLDKVRRGQMKVQIESVMENSFEMKTALVSQGMVEPALTPEEAGELKPGVLDTLNKRIREISGIDEEAAGTFESFRKE